MSGVPRSFIIPSILAMSVPFVALADDNAGTPPGASAPGSNAPGSNAPGSNAPGSAPAAAPTTDTAPSDGGEATAEPAPLVDPAKEAAKSAAQQYLTAVKAKKWDVARKLTHPKTLQEIADIKKRKGVEDHELAPWAKIKENYLVSFELGDPESTANGAMVVPSTQTIFSVEDKGTEDGVKAEYLVIPLAGKWYVTSRRLGENEFPADSTALAFKGYFEGEYVAPPPEPTSRKKHKKSDE
jgi:hypothetical protein